MLKVFVLSMIVFSTHALAAWMPPGDAGCVVSVIPTNYSFIGRCGRDEVVTEVWTDPQRVRCGRIQVLCRSSKGEAGETVEEPVDTDRHS